MILWSWLYPIIFPLASGEKFKNMLLLTIAIIIDIYYHNYTMIVVYYVESDDICN